MTFSVKEKRTVVVIVNPLFTEMESPICRPELTYTEVCSLHAAQIRDTTKKLPSGTAIPAYQVSSNKVPIKRLWMSRGTPGTWDNLSRDLEHKLCFCSSRCRQWWDKTQENPTGEHKALRVVLLREFVGFWSWVSLHDTEYVTTNEILMPQRVKRILAGFSEEL